jgi:hypothetical protein
LPAKPDNDGPSLLPLLRNPKAEWPHISLTHAAQPGTFGLSAEDWRYIHYSNGDEELYDVASDPYEWTNLAEKPQHQEKLKELRALAPQKFASFVPASAQSLPKLAWHPASDGSAPPSKHDGGNFDVVFFNERSTPVLLFKMGPNGRPEAFGEIKAGTQKSQTSGPGEVWMVADPSKQPLGHFVVDDRTARAMISDQ